MEPEYLKQLFEEDKINTFRRKIAKEMPWYHIDVMIHDVSNIGRLVLTAPAGPVCAEFNISNYDCKRTPEADWWYEDDTDILVDDNKVRKVYIATMAEMFPDYAMYYHRHTHGHTSSSDANAGI